MAIDTNKIAQEAIDAIADKIKNLNIYRRAMENARSALGRAPSDDKEAKKREGK